MSVLGVNGSGRDHDCGPIWAQLAGRICLGFQGLSAGRGVMAADRDRVAQKSHPFAWERRAGGRRRWAWLLLPLALGGCASAVEGPLFFSDAGKYQYHNCDQLAAAAKNQMAREQELKGLIDKAEQSAGGILVSLMAYKTDYVAVEEELRVIESTARSKNCLTPSTWQSNGVIR